MALVDKGRVSGGSKKRRGKKDAVEEAEKRDSRNEGLVRKSKFVIPIDSKTKSRELETELSRRYKFDRVIGDGNFAIVSRCVDRRDGTPWAVKEIDKANVKGKNALQYLHSFDIVHRDVKLENLLLTEDRRVKLADFGLACKVEGKLYRVCGTPTYVAAEILAEQGYGLEVDVWSLGVILHIMLVGYAPFRSSNRDTLFRLIQEGQFSFDLPGWEAISHGAQELVRGMVEVDVARRVSARQILRNSWLRKMIHPKDL